MNKRTSMESIFCVWAWIIQGMIPGTDKCISPNTAIWIWKSSLGSTFGSFPSWSTFFSSIVMEQTNEVPSLQELERIILGVLRFDPRLCWGIPPPLSACRWPTSWFVARCIDSDPSQGSLQSIRVPNRKWNFLLEAARPERWPEASIPDGSAYKRDKQTSSACLAQQFYYWTVRRSCGTSSCTESKSPNLRHTASCSFLTVNPSSEPRHLRIESSHRVSCNTLHTRCVVMWCADSISDPV